MNRISYKLAISAIFVSSLTLAGCHTMHGLGEDISSGGQSLARAAEPSKKKASAKTTQTTKSTYMTSSSR